MVELTVGGVTSVHIGRNTVRSIVDGTEPAVAVFHQPGSGIVASEVAEVARGRGVRVAQRELPDGEAAKNLRVVEESIEWLAETGLRRDGVVVGVGGGALCDAVGFLASIYLRGVEARYVPTTLLGAVDAAIGGKTAVNVGAKNLAGTFSHPARVVIDIGTLEALPDDLRADGLVEALKAGLVGDPELVRLLEEEKADADLETIVARAVAVKAAIVGEDFRETGKRAHLNFGHTIGHAIEMAAGWRHGPAVATGMVAAAVVSSEVTGFTGVSRVIGAIRGLDLAVAAPGLDPDAVRRLIMRDKKGRTDEVRMVLLEAVGRPVVAVVDDATLGVGLASIGIS